jgi:hypothetical protein
MIHWSVMYFGVALAGLCGKAHPDDGAQVSAKFGNDAACCVQENFRGNSPERTNTASFKKEGRSILQCLAGPPHGKGPEDVSVCDNEDVAAAIAWLLWLAVGLCQDGTVPPVANVLNQSIETLGDLLR